MYKRRFDLPSLLLYRHGRGRRHLHGPTYYTVGVVVCTAMAAFALAVGEWGGPALLAVGAVLDGVAAVRQRG